MPVNINLEVARCAALQLAPCAAGGPSACAWPASHTPLLGESLVLSGKRWSGGAFHMLKMVQQGVPCSGARLCHAVAGQQRPRLQAAYVWQASVCVRD